MTGFSPADLDRRKARIVACLHPTRIKRGFVTRDDIRRLGEILGVSRSAVHSWESGNGLVHEEQLPVTEAWLASGPVYRYAGIDRIVGPEDYPLPLDAARQSRAIAPETTLPAGQTQKTTPSPDHRPAHLRPPQNHPTGEGKRGRASKGVRGENRGL